MEERQNSCSMMVVYCMDWIFLYILKISTCNYCSPMTIHMASPMNGLKFEKPFEWRWLEYRCNIYYVLLLHREKFHFASQYAQLELSEYKNACSSFLVNCWYVDICFCNLNIILINPADFVLNLQEQLNVVLAVQHCLHFVMKLFKWFKFELDNAFITHPEEWIAYYPCTILKLIWSVCNVEWSIQV